MNTKNNARKNEFAEHVMKEFLQKGYSGLSISALCTSLDCSRQSFYYYFKKIEDSLQYYLREELRKKIRDGYMVSDMYRYFEENRLMYQRFNEYPEIRNVFWNEVIVVSKKSLDFVFTKTIIEYLGLKTEEKDFVLDYYTFSFLHGFRNFFDGKTNLNIDECIALSKSMIGSVEDVRRTICRLHN